MDINKIELEIYQKAISNAESIVNRELTDNEKAVLMLGYQYGRKQGRNEGIEDYAERIKNTLNKLKS